jgi:hypothetical protein
MEDVVVRLEVLVNVDGAVVLINGKPIGSTPMEEPLIIRRGEHEIRVEREGYKPEKLNVKLWDEKESTVRVTLAKEETADLEKTVEEPVAVEHKGDSASLKKTGAWISFGVGGASAVAAIIVGAKQLKKVSEIEENCTNKQCDKALSADRDKARGMGVATNILSAAAVVGIAAGTILLLLDRKQRKREAPLAVVPGFVANGGGMMVVGRF